MAFFDMPLDVLTSYRPAQDIPVDFADFWETTLHAVRSHPLSPSFALVDYGLRHVDIFDVTFAGYAGQPIKGWLVLPAQRSTPLPCVVEYVGYGGGRGHGFEHLTYAAAGFAHFVMDTRGQGSTWRAGDTPDIAPDGDNAQFPGFMTRGILQPETYYYRRVFSDAVRAIEAARAHPAVDAARIAVTGGSQGGGIAIAAAGLVPDIQAVLPDVPFLCAFRRAVALVDTMPYAEITNYLKTHRERAEQVFGTLRYFDGAHFAARSRVPALYSVALMDTVCPPSTVFSAYNQLEAPKQIHVYDYNGHEGGGALHTLVKLRYLNALWSTPIV